MPKNRDNCNKNINIEKISKWLTTQYFLPLGITRNNKNKQLTANHFQKKYAKEQMRQLTNTYISECHTYLVGNKLLNT